ncbi:nuclease-related domain-containing protein [Alkalibacterium sp. f15]|uniref:nuclease-related domain-containing protein n=1 Tax=Alkalibacterium sp. f15 TaxID=3414029 RepID=UPI003BF8C750
MIIKEREEPYALKVMTSLNNRMTLTQKQKNYYSSLVKGLEGEKQFDSMIAQLSCNYFYLKDLTLKTNRTYFQVDSLLIKDNTVHLYEVKNYEGEYTLEDNKLINFSSNKEILNPAIQLERSSTLLRQLLDDRGIDLKLDSHIVFVNPEFILYQSSRHQSFILPGMLRKHLNEINRENQFLSDNNREYAGILCGEHLLETPYTDLPDYSFETLEKGFLCFKCSEEIKELTGRKSICRKCGYKEAARIAVLRHVHEYFLLFPNCDISTHVIHKWCNQIPSTYTIRSVLKQNYEAQKSGRWTVYS